MCAAQSAPIWSIGGEDAIGTEIGLRARVVQLPRHLLLIERDAPFLKLITPEGQVRQQLGRLGGGPAEFRQPSAAFFDATRGELYVVDGAAVRVSVYALRDSLRFVRSLAASEPGLEGLCMMRGRWFGLVRNAPTMLREFAVEGDRLVVRRSFAEPKSLHPLSAVPALRNEASGMLYCDDRAGELIVVSRTLGEVHRIDTEGTRHAVHAIPGFTAMPFGTRNGTFFSEIRQGSTFDIASAVAPVTGDVFVVVARRAVTPQGQRTVGYFTQPLSAAAANGSPTLEPWGHVAEFAAGAVCLREEPAPTLAMFPGGRCPSR